MESLCLIAIFLVCLFVCFQQQHYNYYRIIPVIFHYHPDCVITMSTNQHWGLEFNIYSS